jgi:hypothetical protein
VDWTLPVNQDRLTDTVWITRATNAGLFNIKSEASFNHDFSPAGTEWAFGTTTNFSTLTYKDWETWTGGPPAGPPSTVGQDAVLHLLEGNIYMDLKFTSWGTSSGLGSYSYVRSTRPPSAIEAWRLLHFGTADNTGGAAATFDFDKDGLTNLAEFAFGLDPKSGSSLALPQPQLLAGVLRATFAQPPGVAGITYRAEWSPTLTAASWKPLADIGTGTTHTFEVPGTNPRAFLRYLITLP